MDSPRWVRLLACVGAAGAIWISPAPDGLPREAWCTLAVFVGVIGGFLLRPLEMAPTVLCGLTVLLVTSTIDTTEAFRSGFGDRTVWLVVAAFLIAGAVERTGLGRRIALYLLRAIGRSMLGLGYAIAATELVLGPFIPSNTARGGGVVAPIVRGLAGTLDESIEGGIEGGASTGPFLVQTASHANLVCSAMFLTAMAGNSLIARPAEDILGQQWDFARWLQGSIVPGLAGLALVPAVVRALARPPRADVARVRSKVEEDLRSLGPWRRSEITLVAVLAALLGLWATSGLHGLHPAVIALAGIIVIVASGTQSWKEIVGTSTAWDALLWLGGFVALAEALKLTGFTEWMQNGIAGRIEGIPAVPLTVLLGLIYFATMFFFSQLTAHIAALAGVFGFGYVPAVR